MQPGCRYLSRSSVPVSYTHLDVYKRQMLPHTRRTELTTCFEFAAAGRIPYTGRLGILSAEDKKQIQNSLELVDMLSMTCSF